VVITQDEYLRALEQVPVAVAGAAGPTTVEAGRMVLDQLVARKVVEIEAAKRGALATDAEVERRYQVQTRLLQQQMPGVSLEAAMKRQGTTAQAIKAELRYQMAETNLLAKELNISEDDLKKSFQSYKDQFGLPERAVLRIVAPADAEQLRQAQQQLQAKTDYIQVARQFNPPSLRATSGLMGRPVPIAQLPETLRTKMQLAPEGMVFGPVAWPAANNAKSDTPPVKVWMRVEKKLPAVVLSYEEAKPILKQQLVQMRLADPKNEKVRRDIAQKKMNAQFQASDPRHQAMWEALKRATRSGLATAAQQQQSSK
jgi:hypothetical protein